MTASHLTQLGTPVRAMVNSVMRSGEFAGLVDRAHGRVRIGHRVKTFRLDEIEVLTDPTLGDRWADKHRAAH